MSFQRQQHYIDGRDCCGIIRRRDARVNVSQRAAHAHAISLHRVQMGAARDQRHVFTRLCEHRADESADGARADYGKFHDDSIFSRLNETERGYSLYNHAPAMAPIAYTISPNTVPFTMRSTGIPNTMPSSTLV